MARHGAKKSQKRISASKAVNLLRKEEKWTIKTVPGAHSGSQSVPLGVAVRDLLKLARNKHEVKTILNKRIVSVDGVIKTDYKFPIGLFDVVGFTELKKYYRALLDKKGRIFMKEITAKDAGAKLVKVTGKRTVSGKKIQLSTNDGRNFLVEPKEKISIGDTLKIGLPEQKIVETLKLEKGNIGFIFMGKRMGETATIDAIAPGTMRRGKLLDLKPSEGNVFRTLAGNLFVVGKKKPEVEVK
ncbi:MAG: 30S ribosomal protein S4e [Candidatus Diapherotrites archaeon]|nr:30S ribosomal protein S4e [Candidatus Diapherotrites archaeon]